MTSIIQNVMTQSVAERYAVVVQDLEDRFPIFKDVADPHLKAKISQVADAVFSGDEVVVAVGRAFKHPSPTFNAHSFQFFLMQPSLRDAGDDRLKLIAGASAAATSASAMAVLAPEAWARVAEEPDRFVGLNQEDFLSAAGWDQDPNFSR